MVAEEAVKPGRICRQQLPETDLPTLPMKNKPPPQERPRQYNVPLLACLGLLAAGLAATGYSVFIDGGRTSVTAKCVGCGLVGAGLFSVLLCVLFTKTPSFLRISRVDRTTPSSNYDDRGIKSVSRTVENQRY